MPKVVGRNFGASIDVQIDGLNAMITALELSSDPRTLRRIRGRASAAAAKTVTPVARRLAPVANAESIRKGAVPNRLKKAIRSRITRRDKEAASIYIKPGKDRKDLDGAYYRWVIVRGTRGTRDVQRADRQAFYQPLQAQGYTRKARYRAAREAGMFVKTNVKRIEPRPFIDVAVALSKSKALERYAEVYERYFTQEAFKKVRI